MEYYIQEKDLSKLKNGNILKGNYWTHTQPFGNNVYSQYNGLTYGFIYMNEKIKSFEDIIIFDKNLKRLIPVIKNPGSSGSFEVKILLKSCTLEQKIYFICKKWKQRMETSISRRNIHITPNKKRKISNNGINVHTS